MSQRTIAITGLNTFLGFRLAERLLAQGHRIVGLDRRRPYRLEGRLRFARLDFTDPTADGRIAEVLEKEEVETLIHAAFRVDPTPDREMDHELETIGTLHILHAAAAVKLPSLVMASSTMLYGPYPDNPNYLSESHPLRGHRHAHCVQNRVEAESLVDRWRARHPETRIAVLRPCLDDGAALSGSCGALLCAPSRAYLVGLRPATTVSA